MLSTILGHSLDHFPAGAAMPLIAASEAMGWGVLLFLIILGLMVTLAPSRRTSEIKRPRED